MVLKLRSSNRSKSPRKTSIPAVNSISESQNESTAKRDEENKLIELIGSEKLKELCFPDYELTSADIYDLPQSRDNDDSNAPLNRFSWYHGGRHQNRDNDDDSAVRTHQYNRKKGWERYDDDVTPVIAFVIILWGFVSFIKFLESIGYWPYRNVLK